MQRRSLLSTVCAALLATGASAGDGVIEINAARAAAGGVTGSDTPGFPVTISEPGSYRLTSNLIGSASNLSVIQVHSSWVEIDLNGFSLSGGLRGIDGSSGSTDVAVFGGSVHGMAETGIWLAGAGARVRNVRAIGNGVIGILLDKAGGVVVDSIAVGNGSSGIVVHRGAVRGCVVANNGARGISTITAGPVLPSLVASGNFVVAGNEAIEVTDGAVVGNLILVATGTGIRILPGTTGVSATGIGGNVVSGYTGVAWSGPGVSTAPNVCNAVAC